MSLFEIVDDSGVDYAFIGEDKTKRPWKGQIVKGTASNSPYKYVTVEKPYGLTGTYTSSPESFREISVIE